MSNENKLKLYVWENVLTDWNHGVMFALAESPDEARRLIADKMGYEDRELKITPKEITKPEGFFVYGGG